MSCSCCNAPVGEFRGALEPPYAALDKESITPAHQAAQASTLPGSLGKALEAIQEPGVLSCLGARDNNGRTPLMYAVHAPLSSNGSLSMGFLDAFLALPDVASRINHQDVAGNTAMHWAAQEAEAGAKVLAALVSAGAALDTKNAAGETPFHLAVINDRLDNVRYLAEAGADIHAPHGALAWQALHDAAFFGHKEVFAYLLARGADVNATTPANATPISLAAMTRQAPIVRSALEQDGIRVDAKDQEGKTPLMWACRYNQPDEGQALQNTHDIVQALLGAGADVQSVSALGQSTTYFALRCADAFLTRLFLDAGAPVDAPDKAGMTPLHWMAYHAGASFIRLLIMRGANVDARNAAGETPLHVAVRSPHAHHLQVLDVLLREGADVQDVDRTGRTPLAWALARENLSFVKRLMGGFARAGCLSVDEKGRTPLHYACRAADLDVVRGVLDAMTPESWGQTDRRGQNALHFAAAGGCQEVAELLLERQVKSVRDTNGWTPARVAEAKGFTTLASRLEDGAATETPSSSASADSYAEPKSWDVVDGEDEYQIMDDGTTLLVLPDSIIVAEQEWNYHHWDPMGPTRDWSVTADHCCPPGIEEYYFEVEVVEACSKPWGVFSIGWALAEDYTTRFGAAGSRYEENEHTIVIDSDDGCLHANTFTVSEYGPKFGKGDVIGTGLNFADHSIYFTHNGTYLGTAVTNVRGQLYPLVTTNCPGLRLSTRFNMPPPKTKDKPPESREPIPFRTSVETQLDDILFTLYQALGLQHTNPRLSAATIQSLSYFSVGKVLLESWSVMRVETDWTGWPPDALARFRAELVALVRLADPPKEPVIYMTEFLRSVKYPSDFPLLKAEDAALNQKIAEVWKRAAAIHKAYKNVRGLNPEEQVQETQKIISQGGKVRWRDTSRASAEADAKIIPREQTRYEMPVLEQTIST